MAGRVVLPVLRAASDSPGVRREGCGHVGRRAAAAIGHPERFFNMLRQAGLHLEQTLALPDHTAYSAHTLASLNPETILITTKDAVKCAALNDGRLWAVRVSPQFSDPSWLDILHGKLIAARHARGAAPNAGAHHTPPRH